MAPDPSSSTPVSSHREHIRDDSYKPQIEPIPSNYDTIPTQILPSSNRLGLLRDEDGLNPIRVLLATSTSDFSNICKSPMDDRSSESQMSSSRPLSQSKMTGCPASTFADRVRRYHSADSRTVEEKTEIWDPPSTSAQQLGGTGSSTPPDLHYDSIPRTKFVKSGKPYGSSLDAQDCKRGNTLTWGAKEKKNRGIKIHFT